MVKSIPVKENRWFALVLMLFLWRSPWAADSRDPGLSSAASMPASRLFGQQKAAAQMPSAALGGYSLGCLAGAGQLPANGPHWQAMRLSRNRNWGHPAILDYIERLSEDAASLDGWSGLLVGDISQPRGGPMPDGHKSHQIGLDVDIWFRPAPQKRLTMADREILSAISLVQSRSGLHKSRWTDAHARLLKRAASYASVARIFVHPTIKKALCGWAGKDRGWLRKIRAWYGHDDHFHVRLKCPPEKACIDQVPPPSGDGCGAELAWWFSDEPYRPGPVAQKPKAPTLADLPAACKSVLSAN